LLRLAGGSLNPSPRAVRIGCMITLAIALTLSSLIVAAARSRAARAVKRL
jgi:hypothetical protein